MLHGCEHMHIDATPARAQVTSPGGTTITALSVLEEEGVRSAFIKAVGAASAQAKKMSAEQ
jgi:pyrroline-5-carboxylate reductase